MNKILIAFDGTQFSEGAFALARELNEQQPILLTGVFVPQTILDNLWSYSTAMAGPTYIPMLEEEESQDVHRNVQRFEDLCQKNGIAYRVHKDFYEFALPELKRETKFADLLIISSEKFFDSMVTGETNSYMNDAIHASECPVLVVPEKFEFPKRNILTYDGSSSSVFAIKQFAYLFPQLSNNETLLLYVKEDEGNKLPYEDYIEELATQHYSSLSLEKLHFKAKKYFTTWLSGENKVILISGSYERSGFSQVFRRSFVSDAIGMHKFPVFIAHR